MDGSAADDLKSLKILIKELSTTLAESREDEERIDELINGIAVDAGINYEEFKRHQLNKAKDYFRPENIQPVTGNPVLLSFSSLTNGNSSQDDVDLDEIDCEIAKYQAENIMIEQQIQRNEFLITKYLPFLDRDEEILKGLLDFLKEKEYARKQVEKILHQRYENQAKIIDSRIDDLRQRNVEQLKTFAQLEQMWKMISKVLDTDLHKQDKIMADYQALVGDVNVLLKNFRAQYPVTRGGGSG